MPARAILTETLKRARVSLEGALPGWLRRRPGTPATEPQEALELCAALSFQADPEAEGIPKAVARAFSAAPLEADSPLFAGRDAELDAVREAFAVWRSGRDTMLVVTGPAGCGLTSFLNRVGGLAAAGEVLRHYRLPARPADSDAALVMASAMFELPAPAADFDALQEAVLALEPRILVLDGAHVLASRIMGSVQAIRSLGALMVATSGRHFWVLGCHEQAWRRLRYLHQADRYFSRHVELPYLDAEGLSMTIGRRLEQAGMRLSEARDGARGEGAAAPWEALHRLSRGKPDLAFFHLLQAAEFAPESREFRLGAWRTLDYSVFRQLDRDELFALAEIAAHGGLTVTEHRDIFRTQSEDTRLLFAHLSRLGLIECPPDNAGQYRLVPLFADAVIAHLVNGNYLY